MDSPNSVGSEEVESYEEDSFDEQQVGVEEELDTVKKKKSILSDSEDEGQGEEDEETEFEKKSKKLDLKKQLMRVEAEKDLSEVASAAQFKWVPPTVEELEKERQAGIDLKVITERIAQNIQVLADFKRLQTKGIPRTHYIDVLKGDAGQYHGYIPYLVEKIFHIFPPTEAMDFMEANGSPRPVTIRVNTLKTRKKDLKAALNHRGINIEDIAWTQVGLQVFESPVPVGATPEYLAGHYMIQSASSWTPVIALDPQPNQKVLDMAAAPGGKTTHIAALMKNTGELFANDVNADRLKSLVANIHRMGVTNAVVTNLDGVNIVKYFTNYFDKVLLDAPCTGLGVVSKDPSVKVKRNAEDFVKMAYHQKQLILAAIDSLAVGGHLVYSTCSISIEENEEIVDYALNKRAVKLVETGLAFGKPGLCKVHKFRFDPSLKLARRFYPHVYNMDGFFVAKLYKYSATNPSSDQDGEQHNENQKTSNSTESSAASASPQKPKKHKRKSQTASSFPLPPTTPTTAATATATATATAAAATTTTATTTASGTTTSLPTTKTASTSRTGKKQKRDSRNFNKQKKARK